LRLLSISFSSSSSSVSAVTCGQEGSGTLRRKVTNLPLGMAIEDTSRRVARRKTGLQKPQPMLDGGMRSITNKRCNSATVLHAHIYARRRPHARGLFLKKYCAPPARPQRITGRMVFHGRDRLSPPTVRLSVASVTSSSFFLSRPGSPKWELTTWASCVIRAFHCCPGKVGGNWCKRLIASGISSVGTGNDLKSPSPETGAWRQ